VALTTHSTFYFEPDFQQILPFDRLILQIFTIKEIFPSLIAKERKFNWVSVISTPEF
jgi:hypothetical protein